MAKVYNNAGILAAQVAGLDPEMDAAAERVKDAVVAEAEKHRDELNTRSPHFSESFEVAADVFERRGVMDRVVYTTDPGALAIEYGHRAGRRGGKRRLRKWVPGLMIVNEAVNKLR